MAVRINFNEIVSTRKSLQQGRRLPPLQSGDRLTRSEFERRYEAMPNLKKAELIEGVVYLDPFVLFTTHGEPNAHIIGWLGSYVAFTPGTDAGCHSTVRLDLDNEVQPDVLLRLETSKLSVIDADDFISGAPELIVEIAASTASYDLHDKFKVYRRNGVQEYIVWRVYDGEIDWFRLEKETYVPIPADAEGIIRSQLFPGLQLDVNAMLNGDLARVLLVLQQGLATAEHQAFVERLTTQPPS